MGVPSKWRQTVTLPSAAVDMAVRRAAAAHGMSVSQFMAWAVMKVIKVNERGEEMPDGWSPYGL